MKSLGPLVRVEAVEVLEGYNVRLTFQDQTRKEIDLAPFLWGPIFKPIRNDAAMFKSIKVVGSTIGWDNGADIDPDVLYYDLMPAWMEPEAEEGLTLGQRRRFLALPLEERRRLLAEQAEQMIEHYESEQATKEREEWQGSDIVTNS